MHKLCLVVIALIGACGDSSTGSVDAATQHDAPGDSAGSGSGSGSGSGTALTHTLFLETEGVMVTPGADDATTNTSSIPAHAAMLNPWRMGDAQRTTEIAALQAQIAGILAPYDITVTTTRPASGTYHEVIITDAQGIAIGLSGAQPAAMVLGSTCNAIAAPVSFVFAGAFGTTYDQTMLDAITRFTIAMFGNTGGVPQSNKTGDCMCYSGSACSGTALCTIGGANTPVNTSLGACGAGATMDEDAAWKAAFGAH